MASQFFQNWPETLATITLVIGFILASFFTSAIITYIVVLLCGMMIGRIWFKKKQDLKFPFFLILMGLLLGLVIGSKYGDKLIIIILFAFGMALSYYLHVSKIIEST